MNEPFIHRLLSHPMDASEIETRSFAIIDAEVPDRAGFSEDQWVVVRRLIHTTGDTGLAGCVEFSPNALEAGIEALRSHAPIYADSNMIRSGLSPKRLQSVNPAYDRQDIACHVADPDVAQLARETRLPRSLHALRKARARLQGGIAAFGNAPVALLELNRMVAEENLRPALVIGMPVGFVHVIESKEELRAMAVPYIVINGRRGGSPLAVATVHALCTLAANKEGEP
jgi:precorrin-8X/cobalt-precorrin-8 methylmutase